MQAQVVITIHCLLLPPYICLRLAAVESSNQWFQTSKSWRITCLQHLQVFYVPIGSYKNARHAHKCYLFLLSAPVLTSSFLLVSLTIAQNEDVVEQFLKENVSAELQEIEAARSWPCKGGRIQKTYRFDPSTSQTSGLFVAKFTKLAR